MEFNRRRHTREVARYRIREEGVVEEFLHIRK